MCILQATTMTAVLATTTMQIQGSTSTARASSGWPWTRAPANSTMLRNMPPTLASTLPQKVPLLVPVNLPFFDAHDCFHVPHPQYARHPSLVLSLSSLSWDCVHLHHCIRCVLAVANTPSHARCCGIVQEQCKMQQPPKEQCSTTAWRICMRQR